MADEIIKTVENVDRLFSEIVVNGESHVSNNYVPPVQLEQTVPQASEEEEEPQNTAPAQTVQGQDVYAVELNSVHHDFTDRDLTQDLADEVTARQNADSAIEHDVTVLQGAVSTIQGKIPNQASSENQLADKNFVNSSIATNTANFLGTYTSLADIEAIPNPTNNDYAYLDTTDSSGNTVYKRYKYNAEDDEWLFEYDLNNSSFTAEQWATINSGLTQESVDEDIAEAIAEAGAGIEVYPTEEAIIQDLPNLKDGDIVATYGDEYAVNDVPLGSIIAYWGTTDPVDKKWLVLDGRDTTGTDIELQTHYPSLYLHLGGTNVLPDLRECVPVGIGQNGTDTIATHDVYTLGQFKDDSFKSHKHNNSVVRWVNGAPTTTALSASYQSGQSVTDVINNAYTGGDTTHGKQKGVNWIIKAVSTADVTPLPSESIQEIEGYVDEAIAGAMTGVFPDYAHKQLIFNSTSSEYNNNNYVMPDNGMLIASGYGTGSATSYIYFTCNGIDVKQQGYGDEYICNSIMARKGDVIQIRMKCTTVNNGLYFVPCK